MAGRFGRGLFHFGKTMMDNHLRRRPIQESARYLFTSSKRKGGKYIKKGFHFGHPQFGHPKYPTFGGRAMTKGADGLPSFVDWSLVPGAVWEAQDQGDAGTCYIFAPLGACRSVNYIKTREVVEPSAQHVYDCHTATGACEDGGEPKHVLDFIVKTGGVHRASVYPYVAERGVCQCIQGRGITIDGFKMVNPEDEVALKYAVSYQPVVVSIDTKAVVSQTNFNTYKQGVLHGDDTGILNHSALLVGYGETLLGELFWKLLNSYNIFWGDCGYFYIARGTGQKGGALGILREPIVPLKWSSKATSNKVFISTCDSCPNCWRPRK